MFIGVCFFTTNPVDIRDQRAMMFVVAMLCVLSCYIFLQDTLTGIMLLYATAISATKGTTIEITAVMICCIFLFAIARNVAKSQDQKNKVYDFIIWISYFMLLFQAYMWSAGIHPATGLLSNVNETSAFYAIASAACLRDKRYRYLIISAIGLMLSTSMGGVLAVALMIVIWGIRGACAPIWHRKVLIAPIFIGAAFLFAAFIHPADIERHKKDRLEVWKMTAIIASEKFTGWGFGEYEKVIPLITSWRYTSDEQKIIAYNAINDKESAESIIKKIKDAEKDYFTSDRQFPSIFRQAHNEFVEWYFIGGFVGLMLILWYLTAQLWKAARHIDQVPLYGIIAACGTAMTFFTWHMIPLIILTIVYLGFNVKAEGE